MNKVQFSSVAQSCSTLCNPINLSTPGLPVHRQLPKFIKLMSTELVMTSNHLILCHPLLLLPSIFPSIRAFSNKSALHIRWPNIGASAPSNEYSGLISFRITWCGLLAVTSWLLCPLQLPKAPFPHGDIDGITRFPGVLNLKPEYHL